MNNLTRNAQVEIWAKSIGGFLLNFGVLELDSILWIRNLGGVAAGQSGLKKGFGDRIDIVIALIRKSDWTQDRKQSALDLWLEVKTLAKTRNTIAHNPLFTNEKFGILQVGIINVKNMKGIGPFLLEPLSLEDINLGGIRVCELFDLLQKLR